jgi:TonB-linked SusC/RagA family outer membrane protein
MAGASYRNEDWRKLEGWANGVPDGEDEYHYISQGDPDSRRSADDGTTYRGESYFGRITYNYADKYLLSATMRADGSSKYQEKWGYFPSVGLGWVVSEEDFMSKQNLVDHLKLRASYGMLGNDKVPASDGFASVMMNQGTSGVFGDVLFPGYVNQNYFSSLKWEVVKEFNIGVDMAFLDRRLNAEFDYFHRLTDNAVISTPLPMGAGSILDNSGQILNSGLEFSLNWSDKIGKDFKYHASLNLSTLNNEVKDLKGIPYLYGGSAEFRTITKVGESINSYYGYKVEGVYQTQEQVDNDPIAQKYGLQPGDLMYEDVNGDDSIDDKDRQILGSALPTFTYGGSLGFEWKNLDFGMTFMGVMGNEIVNQKRGNRRWQGEINYDADMVKNRWTGAGSTNKYPSAAGSVRPWNVANFSSFLVEKGDFFRIQNIQIGYNFNNLSLSGMQGTRIRVYVSADNPLTVFDYNGFTPEIASGFDNQVYPMYSTYTFGLKLTF